MSGSKYEYQFTELNPKQPEFVLATSDYRKRVLSGHSLAHFYQFKAEYNKMGVIPDACVDILFWKKGGKLNAKIAGSRLGKGDVDAELDCEYFGVRFMPGINPVKDIIKLSELINKEENFEDMVRSSDEREQLMENIYFADTFEDKIKIFMDYYARCHDEQDEDRNSLKYVLQKKICNENGSLKLDALSSYTGYSERYLNIKIHEYFGLSPKNLIRIIRFQKAVGNLTGTITDINYVDTAIESGYYDQSHFNKEFRNFSGATPTNYISNLLYHSYHKKLHVVN